MEIRLSDLAPGQQAAVTAFYCPQGLRRRLGDFGMVEGTVVTCRYRSPGGDVTALFLRGTTLAIRSRDLAAIAGRRL